MLAWTKEPAPFPSAFDGSELLGIEVLEEHARRLAAALTLSVGQHGTRSRHLRRLDKKMRALRVVYSALSEDAGGGEAPSPAAEWLLDNFFVVAAAAHDVRHDLPTAFFKRLPRIEASMAGVGRAGVSRQQYARRPSMTRPA